MSLEGAHLLDVLAGLEAVGVGAKISILAAQDDEPAVLGKCCRDGIELDRGNGRTQTIFLCVLCRTALRRQ